MREGETAAGARKIPGSGGLIVRVGAGSSSRGGHCKESVGLDSPLKRILYNFVARRLRTVIPLLLDHLHSRLGPPILQLLVAEVR